MRRLIFRGLLCLLLMLIAFAAGVRVTELLLVTHEPPIAVGKLFTGESELPIAPLRAVASAATTARYQPGMQAAVQDLRIAMRGLGLYWWPKAYLFVAEESS